MGEAIRVVILHQKRLWREGLTVALSHQQHITVVGSVAKASEIVGALEELRPDVMLVDFALPDRDGLGEARLLHAACPGVKILMMGLSELEADVVACIEAGAVGYLPQDASVADLLHAHSSGGRRGDPLFPACRQVPLHLDCGRGPRPGAPAGARPGAPHPSGARDRGAD